jgi:hypothetical protein
LSSKTNIVKLRGALFRRNTCGHSYSSKTNFCDVWKPRTRPEEGKDAWSFVLLKNKYYFMETYELLFTGEINVIILVFPKQTSALYRNLGAFLHRRSTIDLPPVSKKNFSDAWKPRSR